MIEKCCICEKESKDVFALKFKDLIGSGASEYIQHIGQCDNCGFIFTKNPFSDEQLEQRYKKLSKFEYDDTHYDYVINDIYKQQCIRQKNFIDEAIGEDGYDSVFEVGGASGYNLGYYQKKGKKVYGVEPSLLNCKLAKQTYDVDMFNGMFDEYLKNDRNDKFDIVFLSMVLEHIVNPYSFMKECSKITNKYIYIEVPTLDYKVAEEPYGMFCEEHVNIFTRESLTILMNKVGFEVVSEEILFNERMHLPAGYPALCTLWKKSLVTMKPIKPMINSLMLFESYIKQNQALLDDIKMTVDNIDNETQIGLWGVGHHVAMLLGETSLKEKNIVAVYDSDERKRGMLISGVAVKPFDIDDLLLGRVDKILITTYTAQNSIRRYIKNNGWDMDRFIFLYDLD